MKKLIFIVTCSFCAIWGTAIRAQSPPSDKIYTLAFSDDFSGSILDANKWNYRMDAKDSSAQLPSAITLDGSGNMNITPAAQTFAGYNYVGGGIISQPNFRYGYFQVQAQTTTSVGWHTSFWMMAGNGGPQPPTNHMEIDDFEIDSASPSTASIGYVLWPGPGGMRCSGTYSLGFDSSAAKHYYGVEWTEGGLTYFVDDHQVCSQSYDSTANIQDRINIWLTSIATAVSPGPITGVPSTFSNVSYYVADYYVGNSLPGYNEPGFSQYGGGWSPSSLTGFSTIQSTYSCSAGAVAMWTPTILAAGNYDVSIWKTQYSSSDPAAQITVNYNGGSSTVTENYATGTSSWIDLGTFAFAAGSQGSVVNTFSGSGCIRASAVKFIRTS